MHRLREDEGLTLVEMLVAIFVIGLVLMAMASVAIASMRSVQVSERTVRATQLGNEVLEHALAIPYDSLGLYETEATSYFGGATFEGSSLVILPDPSSRDDRVPWPSTDGSRFTYIGPDGPEEVVRDGIRYHVETAVVWVNDPATAAAQDFKHVIVTLTWQHRGEDRTARVESYRAPGPDDQMINVTVTPDVVRLRTAPDGHIAEDVVIEVASKEPQNSVKMRWLGRTGATDSLTLTDVSPNGTLWRGTIKATTKAFKNGETLFAIQAFDVDGNVTAETIGRALFLHPLEIRTADVSISPTTLHVLDDGTVCDALDVSVLVIGAVSSDSVTMPLGDDVHALPVAGDNNNGTYFSAGFEPDDLPIQPGDGSLDFTVDVIRTADNAEATLTVSLGVETIYGTDEEPAQCPS